ncbi:hypothetical protein BBP40_003342 [Aspergillus hancockii]|nr:hypothetical protein BBP40_003342 [Aspergillus hancockii]
MANGLLLQDKVVIVTGSSSGIGLATVTAALEEGARVVGVDRSPVPPQFPDHANFRFVQGDLADTSTPEKVVKTCLEAYGGQLDALVNVAGIPDNCASVDTLSDDIWDVCIAVNLTAAVKMMRAAIPTMRLQKSGSIVNVSSRAGLSGATSGVAYTASKHGLIGVTKNVAWRFKDENIRCNAVCPGGILRLRAGALIVNDSLTIFPGVVTNLWAVHNSSQETDLDALETLKPIHATHMPDGKPYILPEQVAQTILFLVSSRSAQVNGILVPVDNAWSAI